MATFSRLRASNLALRINYAISDNSGSLRLPLSNVLSVNKSSLTSLRNSISKDSSSFPEGVSFVQRGSSYSSLPFVPTVSVNKNDSLPCFTAKSDNTKISLYSSSTLPNIIRKEVRQYSTLRTLPFSKVPGGSVPSGTTSTSTVSSVSSVTQTVRSFATVPVQNTTVGIPKPEERFKISLDLVRQHARTRKDAFYIVDLAELAYKHQEWCSQLPRVQPFYAVKCNDDPQIVQTLASLGANFDCASKGEMSMVLGLGVQPENIIFAHPAKQPSHLAYAKARGVTKMTFDNEDELRKIALHYPNAQVVLRILADDSASVCRLGLKFGAPLASVRRLLSVAKELNLDVLGVSYHVGSGNGKAESFADAVRDARTAFDIGAELGLNLRILDIGGGFPGSEAGHDLTEVEKVYNKQRTQVSDDDNPYAKHPSFRTIATHVRTALDKYFPPESGIKIIAEPGRFYVKSTHILAVNIVGKRATDDEGGLGTRWNYYVNDGLYGSFNCVMYDHATAYPNRVIRASLYDKATLENSTVPLQEMDLSEIKTAAIEQQKEAKKTDEKVIAAAVSASLRSASTGTTTVQARGISTSSVVTPPQHTPAVVLNNGQSVFVSTLWGPTCDSIDKITDVAMMPELAVGDWLIFDNMGAYTIAGSCRFNGFPLTSKVYRYPNGSIIVQDEEEHT